jgi:hypothetical protein
LLVELFDDSGQRVLPVRGPRQFRPHQRGAGDHLLDTGGQLQVEAHGRRFFIGLRLVQRGVVGQVVEVRLIAERKVEAIGCRALRAGDHLSRPGELAGPRVDASGEEVF